MGDVTLNVNGDSAADRSAAATRFQVNPVRYSQQQQYQQPRNGHDQQQQPAAIINAQQLNGNGGGGQLDDGMTIEMYRTAPAAAAAAADGDVEANERDTFPDDTRTSVIPPRLSR